MFDTSKLSLQSALPIVYSYIINPKVCYLFIPVFQAKYGLHNGGKSIVD